MDTTKIEQMLEDLIFINSVLANELITSVEALAKVAYGVTPELCVTQHNVLKTDIIGITEKWKGEEACRMLYNHNLRHGESVDE